MSHRSLIAVSLAAIALPGAAAAPASASSGPCSAADLVPTADNVAAVRGATLCLLNRERRSHGLRPLRRNRRLGRAAKRHTQDMVERRYFAHETPSGTGLVARLSRIGYISPRRAWSVGENIAWGTGSLASAREIVSGWMHSPPHRHNILTRGFREIGIGIAFGVPVSGYDDGATYTTDFGAHR